MNDDLQEIDLECPICYEMMETIHMFVSAPNDLGCTHNFCPVCASDILKRAKKNREDALCPMCRRVVVGAVPNVLATSLAKINKTLKIKQGSELEERIERVTHANMARIQEYETQLNAMNTRIQDSAQKECQLQQQLEHLGVVALARRHELSRKPLGSTCQITNGCTRIDDADTRYGKRYGREF